MIKYQCDPCEFITYHKSEYTKHLRTKKHQTNCPNDIIATPPAKRTQTTETFECGDCHVTFDSDDKLNKHSGNCPVALRIKVLTLELEKEKEKFQLQNEKLELKLKLESALKELNVTTKFHKDIDRQKDRTIEFIEEENKYHKSSLDKQSSTVNKITTSAIKYLQQHCPNAPKLEAPPDYDLMWEELGEKFLGIVCTWADNKHLAERLSERLLLVYKKKDPTQQSLWGIDSSRNNYAEKEEDWTIDKAGAKLKEKIIIPFIDDLIERVREEYNRKSHNRFIENMFPKLIIALEGSGSEALINSILKKMCAKMHLDKEGKMKDGKFLTYVKKEEETDTDTVSSSKKKGMKKESEKDDSDSEEQLDSSESAPIKNKKQSPKKIIKDDSDDSDSDDCGDTSEEECDKKCKPSSKPQPKKGIVMTDTKKTKKLK